MSEPSETRELDLVGKVEFRIALADSDTKLSTLLKTYLAPLLLKLTSSSQAVRNKVIGVCQHINNRVKSPSIALPVFALVKQFREVDNPLVRHFDLLYIQQGLDRLDQQEKTELLLEVLKTLSVLEQDDSAGAKARATIFNLFLRLLPLWKLPARGTKEDTELRTTLGLADTTWQRLSAWLTKFLLLEPTGRCPGLTQFEEEFLQLNKTPGFWAPGTGNNLLQAKIAVANLLASGAFNDDERFIAAVILTADNNAPLSNLGDIIFKQHSFDLEKDTNVNNLFDLYFGQRNEPIRLPARPKLQIRILSLLSKSKTATSRTDRILQLPRDELFAARTGGLEASKLRGQIFSFINWTTRVGTEASLRTIAPQTIQDLRDFIEEQGWPSPDATGQRLGPAEVDLRSHAYESIGILSPYANAFHDLNLVKWLFTSLRCDLTDSQIFVSIEGALGRALNALTSQINETQMQELRPLLEWQMQAELGQDDPDYGFETKRSTKYVAVRFANRCLQFEDVNGRWIDLMAINDAQSRQELAEEGRKGLDPYQFTLLNPDKKAQFQLPSFAALVSFFFKEKKADLLESSGKYFRVLSPAVAFARNILVASALSSKLSVQDEQNWDGKLDSYMNNDEEARALIASYISTMDSALFVLLLEASIIGLCAKQERCGEYLVELLAFASDKQLEALFGHVEPLLNVALSNDRTDQHHAARALGIIVSSPLMPQEHVSIVLGKLPQHSSGWETAVGQQVNNARGSILTQAYILTRLVLRKSPIVQQNNLPDLMQHLLQVLGSRDLALRDGSEIALGQIMLCGDAPATSFAQENFEKLLDGLMVDAKKGHDPAVSAIGRVGYRISSKDSDNWKQLIQKLHSLHEVRRPELHFAVGEAMAVAVAGWHSKSLSTELDVQVRHPKLDQVTDSNLISSTVEKTIEDCRNTKPSLRKAAAIWLLCLIQYCGHLEGVKEHLRKSQAAFASLLSDRDEVVQESGSRGLGLVYEMGDESIKRDLVKDLIQSFTGNAPKLSGQVDEDTVLFDEGALPTGDGASVKTYGEVVKLAQEVGQPSLIYSFMNLAANNAIWTSRAAFGRFGLSNVLANSTLLGENPSFYPKLYRYRFDPNPNVQRSMNDIWTALVKDTNAVLDQHFDVIITDLLKSIVGKEWRVREASCAAIADLVQGREVQKYEKYLNEIWTLAFKVGLDDIKETVRVAGMTLIRTLVNLLIRNLEVGGGSSSRAQMMLGHALPFLLEQLHSGATKEIQEYAVVTMIQIIKKTPSKSLEPYAPKLIEILIGSLSSLEPEMINYIHLNAAKYGLTSEKIDRARISGMGTSPIMEAIERCLEGLDENSMGPSMIALETAMKAAIGLPSKVGSTRAIISLCVRHTFTFRPYADRMAQLVRKLVLDRNETVSISYSMSLAYLMRLVSDKQVEDTIAFVQKLYFESEDASHRAVAGEIVQSISKIANDKFMHFATGLLPIAYIARFDSEEQTRDLFEKSWQDNVGGSRAVTLYLQEIQALTGKYIGSPRWAVKHASAKAIADLVTTFDGDFDKTQAEGVWAVLEKALAGKTWDGKEEIVKALPTFTAKSKSLWPTKGTQMKTIAIREAKRTNVQYRPHAIKALGEFSRARDDINLLPDIVTISGNVLEEVSEDVDDKMEVDGDMSLTPRLRGDTASTILTAVLKNLSCHHAPDTALFVQVEQIVQKATAVDTKATRQALYEGAKTFFNDVTNLVTSNPGTGKDTGKLLRPLVMKVAELAVIQPLQEENTEPESLRLKRAEALVAFASCSLPKDSTETDERVTLAPQIRSWMDAERSIQVRQVLETALRNLGE